MNYVKHCLMLVLFSAFGITGIAAQPSPDSMEVNQINSFLDEWHQNVADADTAYFDKMAEDAIYIGTDKAEMWTKKEFREWSWEYFESGNTWDFTAKDRNVYLSGNGQYAWFDELLDTWMGNCRASGVLEKTRYGWKIKHYQLSLAVPNEAMQQVIRTIEKVETDR